MKKTDAFYGFHPLVNFLYFVLTIGCGMIFRHPVCQLVSLVCSLVYAIYLDGRKTVMAVLKFMLPVVLLTAIINPVFSHEGRTILVYLPSGNPLTLESILYGISAGVMLASVFLWFRCFNAVITSDKFVYLFGRIIPALSLVLSMTLRFVPRFKKQMTVVADAQRAAGRDVSTGSVFKRLRNAVTILSIMITWSLENAIDTADSMKSRGYGLKGRTAFSIYTFDKRDKLAMIWLLLSGACIVMGSVCKGLYWQYYPYIKGMTAQPIALVLYVVYFAMCVTPLIINWKEDAKWRSLKSKI